MFDLLRFILAPARYLINANSMAENIYGYVLMALIGAVLIRGSVKLVVRLGKWLYALADSCFLAVQEKEATIVGLFHDKKHMLTRVTSPLGNEVVHPFNRSEVWQWTLEVMGVQQKVDVTQAQYEAHEAGDTIRIRCRVHRFSRDIDVLEILA